MGCSASSSANIAKKTLQSQSERPFSRSTLNREDFIYSKIESEDITRNPGMLELRYC